MHKKIIVNKFGGGILTKDLIPVIKKRIKEQTTRGYQSIAVVSAMPKMTDYILLFLNNLKENYSAEIIKTFISDIFSKHEQIINDLILDIDLQKKTKLELLKNLENLEKDLNNKKNISNDLEDKVVAYGEKLSAIILTHYLNASGIQAQKILAEEIPIITDNNFKNANIVYQVSEVNINKKLSKIDDVVVISGFTGKTITGEITTLGRGGTDTTACFVGTALKAEKIILWKDVGGVLSADPKIVPEAETIPIISYLEAEESGKIIHDKAIQYVKMFKTPIEIASISDPKKNTKVGLIKKQEKGAKIVSLKKDLSLLLITDENIKVNDLLLMVSEIFIKYKVEITLISNTRYSLQLVANNSNGQLDKVYEELKGKVNKIEMVNASMVFLVGWFHAKDVSNFNDLLVKLKTDLLISAFYYENCYRMEAVIRTDNINKVVKAIYKKFIK